MNHERAILRQRLRRKRRVRKAYRGTADRPRLTVFRSHKHIYCQLVDDQNGRTLCSASSRDKGVASEISYGGNCDAATAIGKTIAEKAKQAGIQQVSFDRGPYKFHGRIAAVAEGAREAGLQF